MSEYYKLLITKERKDGTKFTMSVMYELRAECLVAVEDEFERCQKEPEVIELHLFRIDYQGMKELRRYVK